MTKLPNFFLVGAVKAGTTAFHAILSRHPDIYMSPIKEPNFFSQIDMQPDLYSKNYQTSVSFNLSGYLSGPMNKTMHIADVNSWTDYCLLFKHVQNQHAIGEGSNSYLFCPNAPQEIAKTFPHAKLLMILRNPIERAWSHYLMNKKLGHPVSANFLNDFRADTTAQNQGWGITANYFKLGLYSEQLKRFFAAFPSQQIKVIIYDDFQRSPRDTVTDVFLFLGVTTQHQPQIGIERNIAALPRYPRLNTLLFRSGIASAIKRRLPRILIDVMGILGSQPLTYLNLAIWKSVI